MNICIFIWPFTYIYLTRFFIFAVVFVVGVVVAAATAVVVLTTAVCYHTSVFYIVPPGPFRLGKCDGEKNKRERDEQMESSSQGKKQK